MFDGPMLWRTFGHRILSGWGVAEYSTVVLYCILDLGVDLGM